MHPVKSRIFIKDVKRFCDDKKRLKISPYSYILQAIVMMALAIKEPKAIYLKASVEIVVQEPC